MKKNNRDLLTSQREALVEMLVTTVMRDTSLMLTLSVLFLSVWLTRIVGRFCWPIDCMTSRNRNAAMQRSTEPRPYVIYIENLARIGRAVLEMFVRTDKHTNKQRDEQADTLIFTTRRSSTERSNKQRRNIFCEMLLMST